METQTPTMEGVQAAPEVPTPNAGMSPNDSASQADQKTEAKPAEVVFAEKVLGREFHSVEEAEKTIKNLNSLVGDQTTAKQRKALEKLASQANLSVDELISYADTTSVPEPSQEQVTEPVRNFPDDTTKRLVRIETDSFVKENPESASIRDILFAEALSTGKPVQDVWASRYAPVMEAGKKIGAKKLQNTLEGQPIKATSTASGTDDTKPDFSKMSSQEMEKFLGLRVPTARL
jgi:hypothetical protein